MRTPNGIKLTLSIRGWQAKFSPEVGVNLHLYTRRNKYTILWCWSVVWNLMSFSRWPEKIPNENLSCLLGNISRKSKKYLNQWVLRNLFFIRGVKNVYVEESKEFEVGMEWSETSNKKHHSRNGAGGITLLQLCILFPNIAA